MERERERARAAAREREREREREKRACYDCTPDTQAVRCGSFKLGLGAIGLTEIIRT